MNFEFSRGESFNDELKLQKACTIQIFDCPNSSEACSFCKSRISVTMLKQCETESCTLNFGARECRIVSRRNTSRTSYAVSRPTFILTFTNKACELSAISSVRICVNILANGKSSISDQLLSNVRFRHIYDNTDFQEVEVSDLVSMSSMTTVRYHQTIEISSCPLRPCPKL